MSSTSPLSDEEIVERVRSGEHDLYSVIMERYSGKLMRYATSLVRDEDKAGHIVQDAFIKSYINLNGFDVKKRFSSWIYRIVHNEAMNVVTKSRREVPIPPDWELAGEEDTLKDFEQKETSMRVEQCLEALPLIYAEPLILFYLNGRTYQEISDILRIPVGTVSIRIRRGKKLMSIICQKT